MITLYTVPSAIGVIQGNRVQMGQNSQTAAIEVANGSGTTVNTDIIGNFVTGHDYDAGIMAYQYGDGFMSTRILSNVVTGQNGNVGGPGGIVVNASGTNAHCNFSIVNNTLYNNRTGILVNGRSDLGSQLLGTVTNNIIANSTQNGLALEDDAGTVTNGYNLFFGNVQDYWEEFVPGPGTLYLDPLFVGSGDLHLRAGSPAINAGNNADAAGSTALDLDRKKRILGAKVDLGAYEYGIGELILRANSGEVRSLRSTGNAFGGFQSVSSTASISTGDSSDGSPYQNNLYLPSYYGAADQVAITLKNFSHTHAQDVDILLLGPNSQKAMLMSDVAGSPTGVNLTFQDGAPPLTTTNASGTWSPTNIADGQGTDTFSASGGPYGSSLSPLLGTNPASWWTMFVQDDTAGNAGTIAGGWSVTVSERPWSSGFVAYRYDVYYADVNGDGRPTSSRATREPERRGLPLDGDASPTLPAPAPAACGATAGGPPTTCSSPTSTGDGKADLIGRYNVTGDVSCSRPREPGSARPPAACGATAGPPATASTSPT